MKASSLSVRLFLAAAVWSLVLLGIGAFVLSGIYRESVRRNFESNLELNLQTLIANVQWDAEGKIAAIGMVGEPRFNTLFSGWYWQIRQYGRDDQTLRASRSLSIETLNLPNQNQAPPDENGIRHMTTIGPQGEDLVVLEREIRFEDEFEPFAFAVAGDPSEIDVQTDAFRTSVIWALAILGAASVLTTFFQVRFGLMPLRSLHKQIAEIRAGRTERLEGDFPSEISPLADEMNALIASNTAIIERARTHVGNLAHALKTPLSVIANEAHNVDEPLGGKIAEQAEIMRAQITHHLARAQVAARANVVGVVTDVHPALSAITRAMSRIHAEQGLTITLDCPTGTLFSGERQDLEEMAGNLIDNACKWAHSRVEVRVEKTKDIAFKNDNRLLIVIEDDGPGLTAEQRQEVKRRGARIDESKPGSGLGLSIVAELASLYGGAFMLANASSGGLRAELNLPAAAVSTAETS